MTMVAAAAPQQITRNSQLRRCMPRIFTQRGRGREVSCDVLVVIFALLSAIHVLTLALNLRGKACQRRLVNHNGLVNRSRFRSRGDKISAAFYRLAFPDLNVTVEASTTKGDVVVLSWTARRSAADDRAFAASQKLMTGVTRSRLADGKIVASWTEWTAPRRFTTWASAG